MAKDKRDSAKEKTHEKLIRKLGISKRHSGYRMLEFENGRFIEKGYSINNDEVLGQGSYGKVISGTRPGANGKPENCAVKIVKKMRLTMEGKTIEKARANIIKEAEILGRYNHTTCQIAETDNAFLIFQPRFSNTEVLERDSRLIMKNLSFMERLYIIQDIVISVNRMHHNTLSMKATLHNDIKPANFAINVETNTMGNVTSVDAVPLDFGEVGEADPFDPDKLIHIRDGGTYYYMAPESMNDTRSAKSDIYSLVPIIAGILGADDPMKKKMQMRKEHRNVSHPNVRTAPYDFDGMFNDTLKPDYLKEVDDYIRTFLLMMSDSAHQDRSGSELVLKFFMTLTRYCQIHELGEDVVNDNQQNLKADEEILRLLANKQWDPKKSPAKIEMIRENTVEKQTCLKKIVNHSTLDDNVINELRSSKDDTDQRIYQSLSYIVERQATLTLDNTFTTDASISAATKTIQQLWEKKQQLKKQKLLSKILNKADIDLSQPQPNQEGVNQHIQFFLNYIIDRKDEQRSRKSKKSFSSSHNSNWACLFKGKAASATVKINAAAKMIRLLWSKENHNNEYDDVEFAESELLAFNDGRLGKHKKEMEKTGELPSQFVEQEHDHEARVVSQIHSMR